MIRGRADLSQGEDTYGRLIGELRAGLLRPGDRLTETELAARLGVSRTPVREALRRLEGDGVIEHAPRLGARVRIPDYAEVTELYEMRAVLEGTAARLAARVASEAELAELMALNAEMRAARQNPGLLGALNRSFHATLRHASRNRYLDHAMQGLEKTMLILGPTTMDAAARTADALAEHDAIIAAICARQGARAETLMREHLQGAHQIRLKQLRGLMSPEAATPETAAAQIATRVE